MDLIETELEGLMAEFVPKSAISEKYVVVAATKFWGDFRFRIATDDTSIGITFEPPYQEEILVAYVIKGKEEVEEDLPEGTLSEDAFNDLLMRQLKTKLLLRAFQLSFKPDDNTSF